MNDSHWRTYMPAPGEGADLPYIDSNGVPGHRLDYVTHEFMGGGEVFYPGLQIPPHEPFCHEPQVIVPGPGVLQMLMAGAFVLLARRLKRGRIR